MSTPTKAVVSLSGGMDSCVCAALAARDCDAYAIHFSYGQRTEAKELASAQAVANTLGFKDFLHLKIDIFRRIGGSALTDASIPVPEVAENTQIGSEIPVTYVPFRNAHFLSAAVSWAEVMGAKRIFIGAVEQDSSGYPDCRPAYYQAFQQLIPPEPKRETSKLSLRSSICERRRSSPLALNLAHHWI